MVSIHVVQRIQKITGHRTDSMGHRPYATLDAATAAAHGISQSYSQQDVPMKNSDSTNKNSCKRAGKKHTDYD